MNEEIKKFNEFRTDDDGTYYYYNDKNNVEQWSYNLDNLKKYITNLQEENQKLNKIIDELEKWLKERINRYEYSTGNMSMAAAGTLKATLNKLTELKKRGRTNENN
jgi:cell division septum initiation protein DivIVA